LKNLGYEWKKIHPKFFLTEKHVERRLKFSEDNIATDWNNKIFVDETTIELFSSPDYLWIKTG
jgi:hypothetical protein